MSSAADKYLLMGIANRAKLHFPSTSSCCCFLDPPPPPAVVPVLLAPPISKRLMTFQSVTGPDRCEADVNPCQIESYCGPGIVEGGGAPGKRRLVTLFFTAAGCELCPPVSVWRARSRRGNAGAITHARRPQARSNIPDAAV